MRNIVLIFLLIINTLSLYAQNEDIITLNEVKQKKEGDVTESGFTDDGLYFLTYNAQRNINGQSIPVTNIYFFEDDRSTAELTNILHTTFLYYTNDIIKELNTNFVKREGQLIWDDYTDGSSVELIIDKENEITYWFWK